MFASPDPEPDDTEPDPEPDANESEDAVDIGGGGGSPNGLALCILAGPCCCWTKGPFGGGVPVPDPSPIAVHIATTYAILSACCAALTESPLPSA